MRRFITYFLLLILSIGVSVYCYSMKDLIPATPIGGEFYFAKNFADIHWSEEDSIFLEDRSIEMILNIDTSGVATFSNFYWLEKQSIRDSLISHIPDEPSFNPRINKGQKEETQYRLVIHFPDANSELLKSGFISPIPINSIPEASFEMYAPSKRAWGIYTAYFMNTFQGPISNHMATGGGFKGGYSYTFGTGTSLSLGGSMTVNGITNEIPVNDTLPERYQAPACFGFYFAIDQKIGNFHIYLDAINTLIPVTRDYELEDGDYITGTSYYGWAPGIFVSYSLDVFKSYRVPHFHEGKLRSPYETLQFYTGFREMRINSPNLQGRMWEFGVIVRLDVRYFHKYKFSKSNYSDFSDVGF